MQYEELLYKCIKTRVLPLATMKNIFDASLWGGWSPISDANEPEKCFDADHVVIGWGEFFSQILL